MPMTDTWRHRLTHTGGLARRAGMILALTSCTIVAISTIWGWITSDPIDVSGPARSAVNRTALVGSYAQDCVTRWLTATQAHQQTLRDCWSLRDPMRLPTTPAAVIASPAVSAVTLVADTGTTQHWSVVVSVSERPYESATPHTSFYRLPVVYSTYGVRASALPARINGPGPGADAPLGYPVTLAASSPAFTTVTGFLTSYLTAAGGLERYVTTDSGLLPAADYRSAQRRQAARQPRRARPRRPPRRHHPARAGHRQRRDAPVRAPPRGLPHLADRQQRPLDRLSARLRATAGARRRTHTGHPHPDSRCPMTATATAAAPQRCDRTAADTHIQQPQTTRMESP